MKKLMAILLSLTLACAAVLPALAEGKKDETVYVLANPDGSARRVIVSDYLSNPDGYHRRCIQSGKDPKRQGR